MGRSVTDMAKPGGMRLDKSIFKFLRIRGSYLKMITRYC